MTTTATGSCAACGCPVAVIALLVAPAAEQARQVAERARIHAARHAENTDT